MAMTFDEIPADWLEPGTYLETKPNYRNVGVLPYPTRPLIIGQKLATGTLPPGQIVEVVRPDEAKALFGLGSIGAEQVAAFRRANKTQPLYVMALADAGGAVKATGTLTFSGSISAAAVLRFKIADRPIRFTAAATDTPTQMATKLAAAIAADTAAVVTATSAAGVVTVTARHGGEVGNDIDIRADVRDAPLPQGLAIAVAPMSGGAGNPVLQTALDVAFGTWFTHIQHPWTDPTNMAAFAADVAERWKAMQRRDALGFVSRRGIFSALGTFGEITNSPFVNATGLKASPTSSWVISATLMGLAAFHLTNNPARQLRSLVLPGVTAPDPADQFSDTEQELLLRKGISSLDCLPDGTVTVSRAITTYKVSSLGIPDRAWMDIMVPATMSRIRYDWSGYVGLQYPRAQLVDDEEGAALIGRVAEDADGEPGSAIVTPRRMKGSWAARCRLYAERVWIEGVEETVRQSVFERDDTDRNRLNSRQQVRIAGNLMVSAGSLEFQV